MEAEGPRLPQRRDPRAAAARRAQSAKVLGNIKAARAPLIVMGAYAAILMLPDQSAELIRAVFQTRWWWQALTLSGWWGFVAYLGLAGVGAASMGFRWADRRAGLAVPDGELFRSGAARPAIVEFIGAMPGLTVAASIIMAHTDSVQGLAELPLGAWLALVFFVVPSVAVVVYGLSGWAAGSDHPDAWSLVITGAFGSLLVALGCWTLSYWPNLNADPPTVLTITGFFCVLLALLTGLEAAADWSGWPLFTLVVVAALGWAAMDWTDNHLVASLPAPGGRSEPPTVDAAFRDFLEAREPEIARFNKEGRPYSVLLIAAEGGGARAAFETALVLEQMRVACPDLLRHSFAVLGISGGAVGAMLGAAAMQAEPGGAGCAPSQIGVSSGGEQATATQVNYGPTTRATETASTDMLRPLVRGMLFLDLPMHVLPVSGWADLVRLVWSEGWRKVMEAYASLSDRTRFLEHGLDLAWRQNGPPGAADRLEHMPFSSLWSGPKGAVPALVLLTTDAETGRRVAVSHLRMPGGAAAGPDGACQMLDEPTAQPAERARLVTVAELLPGYEPPATTAALLGARFPGVSGAGRLPCPNRVVRLVDGGVFENSGLTTAMEMLQLMRGVPGAQRVQLVVLQIENNRATTDWSFAAGKQPRAAKHGMPELLSPVRAIAGTRTARADLARVAMQDMAGRSPIACMQAQCIIHRQIELRPCAVPIPLGWTLSDHARGDIRRQLFAADATGADAGCLGPRKDALAHGAANVTVLRELAELVVRP